MNFKKKAASISIGLNILLTVLKFIIYSFTGSITILAEAWHSFSDIATSFAVYFAISEDLTQKDNSSHFFNSNTSRIRRFFPFMRMEYAISFCIGIFMLFVSLSIFRKALFTPAVIVRNPLISGLFFILFSLGSYVVYDFETGVGRKENSVALVSDGMHSRADMVASLFGGFSLILYHFGINIDRFAAIVIALFIFSFSLETITNTLFGAKKENKSNLFQYRTIDMVIFLLEIHNWGKALRYFENKLHFNISPFLHQYRPALIFGFLFLVFVLYFSTSFYMVKAPQEAIIERLGRVINKDNPVSPGLHLKLPWPVDSVIKIDSRLIRQLSVGNIVDEGSYALIWTKEHGTEEAFLSADNAFFYPYVVLHYRIKDIFDYRYHNENPQMLLDNVAHDVMAKIFADKEFYNIVTLYRKQLVNELVQKLQAKLDNLSSGLEIVSVNLKDIHPPIFIASSFEGVIAAYQEKEMIINQAYAYQFESLPQARSEAEKQIKEAECYVFDKTKKAEGEGKRFDLQLMAYEHSPSLLNQWMYYDYIREALQDKRKIIIDPTCGVPELWMNFYEIIEDEKMIEKEKDLDKLIEYSGQEKEKEYSATDNFILEIKKQIERGKSLADITREIDFEKIKKQGLRKTKKLINKK